MCGRGAPGDGDFQGRRHPEPAHGTSLEDRGELSSTWTHTQKQCRLPSPAPAPPPTPILGSSRVCAQGIIRVNSKHWLDLAQGSGVKA